MADDAEYLATLEARRAAMAGIRSTSFSDQQTTFDQAALDKEIQRVKNVLRGNAGTRYAATSKGV